MSSEDFCTWCRHHALEHERASTGWICKHMGCECHLELTQRGFRVYHTTTDRYGQTVHVVESSGGTPGIWIQPQGDGEAENSHNILMSPEDLIDFAIVLMHSAIEKLRQEG